MADSFFGYDSDMPALGAGKTGEYDEGLLEPDDEMDMLNDQTFGDGALFGEDWESEHERLATVHENIGHLSDSQPEAWMKQEFRESPQNELESSLSKLVVEDEEVSRRGQPIPGARPPAHAPVDLDNLFGPSSPSGLFATEELVSGHQNIWGSPSSKGTPVREQEDGLKVLLRQMQTKASGGGAAMHAGISTSLPQALTLEQVEGTVQRPQMPTPAGNFPRALTVEELERQMTGEQPSVTPAANQPGRARGIPIGGPSPPQQPQMPVGTPPQRAMAPQAMRGGLPNGSGHMTRPGVRQSAPVPAQQRPASHGFFPGQRRHTVANLDSLARSLSPHAVFNLPVAPSPPTVRNRSSPLAFFNRGPSPPPLIRGPSPTPILRGPSPPPMINGPFRSPNVGGPSPPPFIGQPAHTSFTNGPSPPLAHGLSKPPIVPGASRPPLVHRNSLPAILNGPIAPPKIPYGMASLGRGVTNGVSISSDVATKTTVNRSSVASRIANGVAALMKGGVSNNAANALAQKPETHHTVQPSSTSLVTNGIRSAAVGTKSQFGLTDTEKKIADVFIQARASPSPPAVALPIRSSSAPIATTPAAPSPVPAAPTSITNGCDKSSLAMAILQGIMGRQGNVAGSPMGKPGVESQVAGSPAQGNRMPGPSTPQQQRIPPGQAHTDPSHLRSQRGAHHPGPHQPSHLKQNLFQERRGFDERMNGRHEPFPQRHDPYMGRGEPYRGGDRDHYPPRGDMRNGPRGDRGGYVQNGRGYPPPRGGYGHHGDDRGGYLSHPRDRDGHHYPDRGRGGGGYYDERDYRKRGPGEHFAYKQRHMVGPAGDMDEEDGNRDIYAGLMCKKEKDWIIKIQLMQLQTDNPYLDDYYYTMWHMKELAKERERAQQLAKNKDLKEPALVLPQLAGRVETKAYMPVQFDNSLGRLTAASVHNPRQIIDLRRDNSQDKEDSKGREMKRFKQLLIDVETAYDVLLVIDDMEKRAHALPEDQRAAVFSNRSKAVHSLYASLHLQHPDSDYFERLVTLRKGIKLVARLIPMLHQEEAIEVTRSLLKYTPDVMNKKGWPRDVLPQVFLQVAVIVGGSKLEHLVQYAASVQGERPSLNITTALQNQFGSSVIWCLLNRGEVVYANESPLDLDVQDQKDWCSFVENVADCLAVFEANISENKVGAEYASTIAEHFKRLLDRGSYLSIEDKLQELCVPFPRES